MTARTSSVAGLLLGVLLVATSAEARDSGGQSVLRVALQDVYSLDPAMAYTRHDFQIHFATCLKLMNYLGVQRRSGSGRLVPEAAEGFPRISRDGRTYTFKVRDGLRFSNGRPISAASFHWAIDRARQPPLAKESDPFKDIVGSSSSAQTLTIRLRRAAPDLPARLALPYFCAIPERLRRSYSPEPTAPLPSGGPYYLASYQRGASFVLRRNPYYRGTRPARTHAIVVELGRSPTEIAGRIERDELDWGELPSNIHGDLARRYGVNRGRYRVQPNGILHYLLLDSARVFGRARVRRAVDHAIDRVALAALHGPHAVSPADQLLTPSFPGYRDVRVRSLRPDLARARREGDGGGAEVNITCMRDREACLARYETLRTNLAPIGLRLRRWDYSYFEACGDIAAAAWPPYHLDAAGSLAELFQEPLPQGCWRSDRRSEPPRPLENARNARGAGRAALIANLDVELSRLGSRIVPYGVGNDRELFSSRVGCVRFNPAYGLDLAALCVR